MQPYLIDLLWIIQKNIKLYNVYQVVRPTNVTYSYCIALKSNNFLYRIFMIYGLDKTIHLSALWRCAQSITEPSYSLTLSKPACLNCKYLCAARVPEWQ
jgi:hypothetical protein